MINRLRRFTDGWLAPCDRRGKILAVLCCGLFLFFVYYLLSADTPWDDQIEERVAAGKKLRPHEFGIIGLWWGSLVSAAICLVALLTVRRWGRPVPVTGRNIPALLGSVTSRRGRVDILLLLLVAVVAGAWIRAPRITHSLWNDEEYAIRRNVWGEWKEKDGALVFDGLDWEEALFFNHNNNHLFHTISSRFTMGIWQGVSGADEGDFEEAAVRTVPFLSGVASIAVLGILGWACGLPVTGVAAAFLLALSPWHLRYSVEARGYSSMILFMLLGMLALIMALREGKWRWWLLYGLTQSAVLLCFVGAMYFIAAQNLYALVAMVIRGASGRWMVWRWGVACALTCIPFVLLMSPSVPQILAYFSREDIQSTSMGWDWLRDVWSHLVGGIPWRDQTTVDMNSPLWGEWAGSHLGTSVEQQAEANPWVDTVYRLIVPLMTAAGLVALCLKNWKTRLLVVAFCWSAVLLYGHNALAENPLYGWYLVFLAPMFALALPATPEVLFHGRGRPVVIAVCAAIVVGYGFLVREPLTLLRTHDRQPMRQTVQRIGELAGGGDYLTGVFGTSDRQVKTYDPTVRILTEAQDVDRLIEEGNRLGKAVFVYYCGDVITWRKRPEVATRIGKDPRFKHVAQVPGLEAMYSYRIYRYEP